MVNGTVFVFVGITLLLIGLSQLILGYREMVSHIWLIQRLLEEEKRKTSFLQKRLDFYLEEKANINHDLQISSRAYSEYRGKAARNTSSYSPPLHIKMSYLCFISALICFIAGVVIITFK